MANKLTNPFDDAVMDPMSSPSKTVAKANYDDYAYVGPQADSGGVLGKIVTSYDVPTSGGSMVEGIPFVDAAMKQSGGKSEGE